MFFTFLTVSATSFILTHSATNIEWCCILLVPINSVFFLHSFPTRWTFLKENRASLFSFNIVQYAEWPPSTITLTWCSVQLFMVLIMWSQNVELCATSLSKCPFIGSSLHDKTRTSPLTLLHVSLYHLSSIVSYFVCLLSRKMGLNSFASTLLMKNCSKSSLSWRWKLNRWGGNVSD